MKQTDLSRPLRARERRLRGAIDLKNILVAVAVVWVASGAFRLNRNTTRTTPHKYNYHDALLRGVVADANHEPNIFNPSTRSPVTGRLPYVGGYAAVSLGHSQRAVLSFATR